MSSQNSSQISRRNFLKAALGLGAVSLTSAGVYHFTNYRNTTEQLLLKKDNLAIKNLAPGLHGYKIAFISDIHLGPYLPLNFLTSALELLALEKPHILILGGDHLHVPSSLLSKVFGFARNPEFATGRPRELARRIIEKLATILQSFNAPHGVIAIAGNHDNSNAFHFIRSIFEKNSIRYLVNETARFSVSGDEIEFVGVDDYWTGVPRLPRVNPSDKAIRVLCAHNPDFVSEVFQTGSHGFQLALAGHTHAGQICTASGRPLICNVYDRSLVHGFKQINNTPLLISAGLGTVEIPHRINCPAEVNLVTLVNT